MERIEPTGDVERRSRDIRDSAGDAAERAGAYVQRGARRISRRAQSFARDAGDTIAEYTGRPLDAWTAGVRGFVREHPLQAVAITLGLGYVMGKLMARD